MAKTSGKVEPTFESALERLEQIVEEMEGDRLPLEELLGRYEEGTRLVKVCQERLNTAEKRIEIITRNASESAELSPFDPVSAPAEIVAASAPSAQVRSAPASRKSPPDEVSLF
jgi:exodeoxyribonuclease VII small subunit